MLIHAIVMAAMVWCLTSVGPMWLKWSLHQGAPLIAGLINGIILGDIAYGLTFGATVMLVFMGVAVIGGAIPSDTALAGYVGVTVSMMAGVDPSMGVTVSATLGALGAAARPLLMTVNAVWVHKADQYAAEGNTKALARIDVLGPVLVCFVLYFLPSFIVIYFGAPMLDAIMAAIPGWLLTGLGVVGKLLPALGLAMLMQLLFKKSLIPFFIFGFVMSAYLGLGIIPIAITGAGFALMHYMYSTQKGAN